MECDALRMVKGLLLQYYLTSLCRRQRAHGGVGFAKECIQISRTFQEAAN